MKLAITIVKPAGYQHSEAFREVAVTLERTCARLGHEATITHELNLPGHQHIVLGAHLLEQPPPPDAIIYNLEQVQPMAPWLTPKHLSVLRGHPVWDYSRANIARLAELGAAKATHVPIGYVPELTRIAPATTEDIDVLLVGSTNERRLKVLKALRAKGLKVHVGFGVYGAARDQLLARAKVVLNVHYYEARVFEIVRVSYLLANSRCVVSEHGVDSEEEEALATGVAFVDYEHLVDRCAQLVADEAERARFKQTGFRLIQQRDVSTALSQALLPHAVATNQGEPPRALAG